MSDLFQRTIPEVLRRTTARSPDKDAFVHGAERLTYAGLLTRAEQLAGVLIGLGVRKGDRVGVFLNQSLDSAVAIHGIMLAGGAFVPIDPTAPPRRFSEVLARCDASVLVTHPDKQRGVELCLDLVDRPMKLVGIADPGHPMVADAVTWDQVRAAPRGALPRITVEDLAYIMWTSGSTGAPKGLTHVHGNGLIYAGMLAETHGLNADDRFLGLSPLHFDMCVMDYITATLVGGTTIIVPEAVAKLPAALTRLAATERATVWYSVPYSMIQMLERGAMEKHDLGSLRWMIFGGEAFPIKHLRALQAALPQARFANAYGPAETHQVSSHTVGALDADAGPIPIGKPWRTLDAIVLDHEDRPVPAGSVGELVVRSPSCMRGYWNDPAQTEAAFFRRPVSPGMDDLYYRTGDLVRMDEDGMMHFLGRKGRQVKVRGYRIELDEVESTVQGSDGVAECAVILSGDGLSLIAAVRCDDTRAPSPEAIRDSVLDRCRARLPGYAVPASIHIVTDFPRTGSEKIDRTALARRLQPDAGSADP